MRERISLPIGVDNFEQLLNNNSVYVDKSAFISNIINSGANVYLFTRPRRFGKTLFQSMLSSFFDIRKESSRYFENLDIYKDKNAVDNWVNKYPVIFISLKDIEGDTFEEAYSMLESEIATLFKSYQYIIDESNDPIDIETFMAIRKKSASDTDIVTSLYFLSELLYSYYGKETILLIDEYDVPPTLALLSFVTG